MKRFKVLSLAALVAFAACDEGTEPVVAPPVTGTISGVVTIEGSTASGVSVTLSSGASATTDGSGAYSFAGVNAGAYTVTISGFANDATFSSTAKAATVTSAGQVVTVNFDGTYVRTSAILGSVSAGGMGLAGVKVDIGSSSVNTDANGQFAFSGLRAGSYTVTISGFDAGQYTFASATSTVVVGVGESKVASFTGTLLATAKIMGSVKIDGAAAVGVTATLSSGAVATTDAAGDYSFSNLTAGNYTVTISGFAADAQFESVAKPVVITSAGSTVTANFTGAFIKTSVIQGTVKVDGTGLAGVKVTLNDGTTMNTGADGSYAFAALRGGTYTVTISGWDATLYSFATPSMDKTVATGESAIADFAGAYVATAKISGMLYIDENDAAPRNNQYDAAFESAYMMAGVKITIEGGIVNDTASMVTTAAGTYEFSGLKPGTYRVTITPPAAGTLAYGGAATSFVRVLAPAGTQTVNFPFDIMTQYVSVSAFLGKDADVAAPAGVKSGVRALSNIVIDLYDTYANATAAGTTGRLGQATTGATGMVTFTYARTADLAPGGGQDNIVFARFNSTTSANRTLNGENVIEIKYSAKDSLVMAPDTLDFLNTGVIMRFDAKQPDGNLLKGWATALYRDASDTLPAGVANQTNVTNGTSGLGRFVETYGSATLPDTFYIRLSDTQTAANSHGFSQTPMPMDGMAGGRFLTYVVDGTNPDSVWVGTQNILWTDQDLFIRAHNEKDDTAKYTTLDAVANSDNLDVDIWSVVGTTKTKVDGPFALGVGTGTITFGINGGIPKRLPTGTYEIRSRSRVATQSMVTDTAITIVLDGSKQADTAMTQSGSKGYSSFAWKYNNTKIAGAVRAADGTDANGATVRIQTAANFIGPARDTTMTITAGSYSKSGLLEGPYMITASTGDSAAVWSLLTTLTGNTSATMASRTTSGPADDKVTNFRATRMDTQVKGVVVNDRDMDFNVIDPDEALANASIQLYRDGSGTISLDTLVATTTTDASGAWSFTGLQEGRYIAKWLADAGNAQVLRGLTKDTAVVTTAATAVGSGANNTRVVGSTTPAVLPRWDYNNSVADGGYLPASFTFLYKNTVVRGTATTGASVAVAGMTVSMRRCNVSAGSVSPPVAGSCTTYLGTTINTVTDATGAFEFTGLTEGVYEITPLPNTVGGFTVSAPAQVLYLTVGNADIESRSCVIS